MRCMTTWTAVAVVMMAATGAMAQYSENFDGYATGSQLHGQGGWKGWDNDPAWSAPTSDLHSVSPANSAEIGGMADLVHEFNVAGGAWEFSTMQFIPDGSTGRNYFLLLNEYSDGGPYDWSVQLSCELDTGTIMSDFGGGASLPIKYGQWAELKFDIDLDANTVDEYYDGDFLATHQWDDTGSNTIGAVDLFGNGASPIYYDNINLVPEPTSLVMLLGSGLGVLVVRLRRRR